MKELAEQAATGTYNSDQRLMSASEFKAMGAEVESTFWLILTRYVRFARIWPYIPIIAARTRAAPVAGIQRKCLGSQCEVCSRPQCLDSVLATFEA